MPKKPESPAESAELRRNAEERLKEQHLERTRARADADAQRLVHELQVHQIELEMRNEELQHARDEIEAALEKYSDLYDFAPVGYLTLDREGTIQESNLAAASLLGIERSLLVRRRLGLSVPAADRPVFTAFLSKVFESKAREVCELTLIKAGSPPVEVRIEAAAAASGRECRAVFTDITEQKRAESALRESEARLQAVIHNTPDHILIQDRNLRYGLVANPQLGLTEADMIGKTDAELLARADAEKLTAIQRKVLETGQPVRLETTLQNREGKTEFVEGAYVPKRDATGQVDGLIGYFRNITESKRLLAERELTLQLLDRINASTNLHTLMREVTALLRDATGCEAVGIRLRDGEDFPYFETAGFPAAFVQAESKLCAMDDQGRLLRDGQGHPVLECMCGNILCGRFDPARPFFTARGSFWTNSTTELLAGTTEADRQARTRNRCHGEGYESVALIRMQAGGETFGLLQFNDRRPGRFTPEQIAHLDRIADHLALALARWQAEEARQRSDGRLQSLASHLPGAVYQFVRAEDGSFEIPYISAGAAALFERPLAELQDSTLLFDDVHSEDVPLFHRSIASSAREMTPWELDFRLVKAEGRIKWLHGKSTPRRLPNGSVCWDGVLLDVTGRKRVDEQLRYQAILLDQIRDTVSATDLEGRITYVNDALIRASKCSRDELLGKSIEAFGDDPARGATQRQIIDATLAGGGWRGEVVNRDSEGHERVVDLRTTVICDEAGRPIGMCGVGTDVTERKRIQAELERSESLFRLDFEEAPVGRGFLKLDGHFLKANQALCDLLGYSKNEFCGRTFMDVTHPEDRAASRDGVAQLLAGSIHHLDIKKRYVTRDQQTVWASVRATLVRDAMGSPLHFSVLIQNITERRRAEEALRESESRYRGIVEMANEGIWALNAENRTTFVNRRMIEMLGYTEAEMLGQPMDHYLFEEDLADHARQMAARRERQATRYERRFRRKDGTELVTSVSGSPLFEAGCFAGSFGMFTDVTQLRKIQTDYQMLFERMIDGFALHEIICDAEGRPVDYRFISMNPAFEELTGLSAEQLVGRTVSEVLPQTEPFWIETYGRVALTGEPVVFDHLSKELGRHFEVSAFRPAPGQFACIILDITERRRAEAALQRDEAELSAIYENSPMMMVLLDADRRVRRLNQEALQFAGRPLAEILGTRGGELLGCIHAMDDPKGCGFGPDCVSCPLRMAFQDAIQTGTPHRRIEARPRLIRRQQTEEFEVLASTARLFVDGEPMVLLCLEDITRQKQAEERVRQQAALLDQTQDAVLVVSLERRFTYANRSAEALYGLSGEALLSLKADTLLFPEHPERCAEICQTTLERGNWSGELRLTTALGARRAVLSRWTLIHDAAKGPASFLVANTDVTEQKRLEEQLLRTQRIESIGTLASGVAHDLNNILAPILMGTELLRPLATRVEDREVVDMLKQASQRGTDIVRQLLTFGRGVEGERLVLQPRVMLKEMAKVIGETFPRNLTLVQQFPENLWPVHADPTHLHQVLLNLCVNARDAMPRGGRLTLAAENLVVDESYARLNPEAKLGPYVVLFVGDTGTGIPPGILDRIFDPFFTTKETGKGTGLGLSTVLGIVRSHGGFLQINSKVGEGTQFKVYLPATETGEAVRSPGNVQLLPRGRGELVLVVDDEEAIRAVLQRALKLQGYRVVAAADGAEALHIFSRAQEPFEAVITDMMMPVMDGATLIRALNRLSPGLAILAMSGMADQESEAIEAGLPPEAFLVKPFEAELLVQTLQKILGERPKN